MLRVSSYSILSTPLEDGSYALMNGISGAVDLVPADLGQSLEKVLANRDQASEFEFLAMLDLETIKSFYERGHLTSLSEEEETQQVCAIAEATHEAAAKKPSFLIVPNFDCNYRCTYCFERPLQNSLYQKCGTDVSSSRNIVMSRDQVDAVYRSIISIQKQVGCSQGGQIVLYGGEPLDAQHKSIVTYIISRGLEEGFCFAAITNGHDLDAYTGLLGPSLIEQIQVTFDGPKTVHDRRRIHRGHESSFDKIVANIHQVLHETEVQIQLRIHVAPDTLEYFAELIEFFDRQGWTNHPRVVIYGSTIYAKKQDGKVTSTVPNDLIAQALSSVAAVYFNVYTCPPAFHTTSALRPVFADGSRFELRGVYCSANVGLYVFAPDGGVYSCWESIGKECSRIGHYDSPEGLVLHKERANRWFNRSVAAIAECQRCPYALVCGGGCAQYAEYNTGSLYKPYCDHFQGVFRQTLAENLEFFLKTGHSKMGFVETVVRE